MLSCLSVAYSGYSQNLKPKWGVIECDFKLPAIISNSSYSTFMAGIADVDFSYQYHFTTSFFGGVGIKYGYYAVNQNAFSFNITGQIETINPFFRIGMRLKEAERGFCEVAIASGFNKIVSNSDRLSQANYYTAWNIEPEIGIYMKATAATSLGLIVGVNFVSNRFGPDYLGLSSFSGTGIDQSMAPTQMINIGFGLSTSLQKK